MVGEDYDNHRVKIVFDSNFYYMLRGNKKCFAANKLKNNSAVEYLLNNGRKNQNVLIYDKTQDYLKCA